MRLLYALLAGSLAATLGLAAPASAAWTAGNTYVFATTTNNPQGGGWTGVLVGTIPVRYGRAEAGVVASGNNTAPSSSYDLEIGRNYTPDVGEPDIEITIWYTSVAEADAEGGAAGTASSSSSGMSGPGSFGATSSSASTGGSSSGPFWSALVNGPGSSGAGTIAGPNVVTLKGRVQCSASGSKTGGGIAHATGTGVVTFEDP